MGQFIVLFVLISIFYGFLEKGNLDLKDRYKQGFHPIVSLIYGLIALFCFSRFLTPISRFLVWAFGYISPSIAISYEFALMVYCLLTLLLFAYIKNKQKKVVNTSFKAPFYAYTTNKDGKIVLTKGWIYVRYFVKYLSFIVGAWATALLFDSIQTSPSMPYFTIYCLLVIYEMKYFLEGEMDEAQPETITDDTEDLPIQVENYEKLWLYYKNKFGQKILAGQKLNQKSPNVVKNRGANYFKSQKELQFEVLNDAQKLSSEFTLTDNDYDLIIQLHQKRDILIANPIYQYHAVVVLAVLLNRLQLGEKILFLIPLKSINPSNDSNYSEYKADISNWLETWLLKLNKNTNPFKIKNFSDVDKSKYDCQILIATPDEMLEANARDAQWLTELSTVVVLDAVTIFVESNIKNQSLFKLLYRHNIQIQTIVLADYHNFLEPSVRNSTNPSSNLREIKATPIIPPFKYILTWKMEGDFAYQDYLFKGNFIGKFMGEESMLSIPALSLEFNNIYLVNQESAPIFEYIEEIRKEEARIEMQKLPTSTLYSLATGLKSLKTQLFSQLHPIDERQVLYIRDTKYNISTTLEKWSNYTTELSFVNIVSPPYLLRDYLADNLMYFIISPLYPIAPSLMKCRFSTAYLLLEELLAFDVEENDLLTPLRTINAHATDTKKELIKLFKECFSIDLSVGDDLKVEERTNFKAGNYIKQNYFRLRRGLMQQGQFDFLDIVQIKEADNVISYITADHLQQNYLLHQIHAFDGKQYKIGRYDAQQKILFVEHINTKKIVQYQPQLACVLTSIEKPLVEEYKKQHSKTDNLTLTEGHFTLETQGYFTYFDKTDYNTQNTYTSLEKMEGGHNTLKREYRMGRILKVELNLPTIGAAKQAAIADTFCLLLKDVFRSLFPEAFPYIVVLSPASKVAEFQERQQVKFAHQTLDWKNHQTNESTLEILVLEDSHTDTGTLKAIYEKWDDILEILDDYLAWLTDKSHVETVEEFDGLILDSEYSINRISNRKEYLSFSFERIPDFLNIDDTHQLIKELMRMRENKLTAARKKKLLIDPSGYQEPLNDPAGRHQCDFCGDFKLPEEMTVLKPDNRERCPKCSETAIDSEEQLRELYKTARSYFENDLGLSLIDDITLHFTDAIRIQKLRGERFVASDRFDVRSIGLATYKNGKYDIYIENGATKVQMLSTLIHEMTHIWQYTHLDVQQMKADYGGLLMEGHAIWTEINHNPAQKELLAPENRNDDYGNGFRLIKKWEQKLGRNPFVFLLEKYPKV